MAAHVCLRFAGRLLSVCLLEGCSKRDAVADFAILLTTPP